MGWREEGMALLLTKLGKGTFPNGEIKCLTIAKYSKAIAMGTYIIRG